MQKRLILLPGNLLMLKDYYKITGPAPKATREEIKKSYRKLAMEYHPDRNRDDPECKERLKEIDEAYRVLGDEEKRRRYDLTCQQSFNRHVYYQEDLSDDPIEILPGFSRGGFGMRGLGGCKGGASGREVVGGGSGMLNESEI
jgi:DnaJ-class molecular chaperone